MVLTHKNQWEKVISPTSRDYNDIMFHLTVEGNFSKIECTKDHKFPTITKTHDDVMKKIVWKKAEELTIKDRILSVVDTETENIEYLDFTKDIEGIRTIPKRRKRIKDTRIKITNHLLELLGLYAAEGSFQNSHGILFTFHEDEKDLIDKVFQYSEEIFGVKPVIRNKKDSKAVSVEILSTEIYLIFRELFNSGAQKKDIPQFIQKISPDKQMQFLKGLILGDGHIKKNHKRITLVTISQAMIYSVSNILERNNIKHSIRKIEQRIDKHGSLHQDSYYLDINLVPFVKYWAVFENEDKEYKFNADKEIKWNSKKWVSIDGILYQHKKIKKIESMHYSGRVYCLNVENTHSFKLECISVHNCIAFWHYDEAEKIVLDLHSYFGKNFMLEVQAHNTIPQKELHRKILKLSETHNIELIAGCDSHFIYPEQSIDRDNVLEAKGIRYEDEEGWYMDYPDGDTLKQRFIDQGILSEEQIDRAIKNTMLFMEFEDYDSDKIKY
ncbi:DNA polymerase III DnaE [compost metagenome]